MEVPRKLKPVTAFIRRAEELDKDSSRPESRLVAYYCRQYAAERAIVLRGEDNAPELMTFLLGLVEALEAEKKSMPEFTAEEGKGIMANYVNGIFEVADEEDRAGHASKTTARRFYAVSTFIEAMQQFGELDETMAQRMKYAKFKAADIIKAIKEGRRPAPGNPLADEEPDVNVPEPDVAPAPDMSPMPDMSPVPDLPMGGPDLAESKTSLIPEAPSVPDIPAAPGYQAEDDGGAAMPTGGPTRQGSLGFAEAARLIINDSTDAPPNYSAVTSPTGGSASAEPFVPTLLPDGPKPPMPPPATSGTVRFDADRQHDAAEYVVFAISALRRQRGDRAVQHLNGAFNIITGGDFQTAQRAAAARVQGRSYAQVRSGAGQAIRALEAACVAIGNKNTGVAQSCLEHAFGYLAG